MVQGRNSDRAWYLHRDEGCKGTVDSNSVAPAGSKKEWWGKKSPTHLSLLTVSCPEFGGGRGYITSQVPEQERAVKLLGMVEHY